MLHTVKTGEINLYMSIDMNKKNEKIKWDDKAIKNFENYLKNTGMLYGKIKY